MKNLKALCLSAIFCVIIAVSAQITIPLPFGVALTLQTFAVSLSGFSQKPENALLSVLCYLLLGVAGVPVFSGFKGGAAILFGKSGGFLFGFILLCSGCAFSKMTVIKILKFILVFSGLLMCHLCGTVYFSFITKTPLFTSFCFAVLRFS